MATKITLLTTTICISGDAMVAEPPHIRHVLKVLSNDEDAKGLVNHLERAFSLIGQPLVAKDAADSVRDDVIRSARQEMPELEIEQYEQAITL